jgi:hypothetical protein
MILLPKILRKREFDARVFTNKYIEEESQNQKPKSLQ